MSEPVSRRVMIRRSAAAAASSILGRTMHARENLVPAVTLVDHLLLGSADLDRGVEWVQRLTGVTAIVGGTHPGRGTRNALLSLGGGQYFEIIAPDPAQPAAGLPKDLRALTTPKLIGWAARATDIDALARNIRARGLQVFGPRDGSRARPDGKLLEWKTLGANSSLGGGEVDPIPFFIEWLPAAVHPSQDSPQGCTLTSLEFAHPDAGTLKETLAKLGIDATVNASKSARLTAVLDTPKGRTLIG